MVCFLTPQYLSFCERKIVCLWFCVLLVMFSQLEWTSISMVCGITCLRTTDTMFQAGRIFLMAAFAIDIIFIKILFRFKKSFWFSKESQWTHKCMETAQTESCHGLGMLLPNSVPWLRLSQTTPCSLSPSSPYCSSGKELKLITQKVKIMGQDTSSLLETAMR